MNPDSSDRPTGSSRARPGGSARPIRPSGGRARPGPETRQAPADGRGADRLPPPGHGADRRRPVPRSAGAHAAPAHGGGTTRTGSHRGGYTTLPRRTRLLVALVVLLLVLGVGWVGGLALWANARIDHVDALSGAADTPGTTYLVAGSDARGGEAVGDDGTVGQRTDTIMLLHRAENGEAYLVSLPRDTLVQVPGYGGYKLNAAYSFGGPPLLVESVEEFTGLTVDHYVEVGFDGIVDLVDAVGTVNLCIDRDVDDPRSGLVMTEGCHDVGGDQALAFVRARDFDPTADLGRIGRQQQFVSSLADEVLSPATVLNPLRQVRLAGAASGAVTTDNRTGLVDLARLALVFRTAVGPDGQVAPIPIENPQFQTRNSGIAILTDDDDIAQFFGAVGDGSL